jgi:Flp pilus assembly protein TadG
MTNARLHNRRFSERGAALAELAVALPILIVVLLGAVDFGRLWTEGLAISNAVRAGAQYGSESTLAALDTTGIKRSVRNDLESMMDASDIKAISVKSYCECEDGTSVDCDDKCGVLQPRTYVQVRVDKTFNTLFPYPGVPKEVTLVRQARCRAR